MTFRIIDGGAQVGNSVTRNVAAHSGVQVNGIFNAAGQGGHATDNAVIVVSASHEVFSYAAVLDNHTQDPIFVVGAQDGSDQPLTPVQTVTPGAPTATQTRTRTPTRTRTRTPTATPPPSGPVRIVYLRFRLGSPQFIDEVSNNSTSTINVGTTVRWTWDDPGMDHTTTSGPCPPCTGDGIWDSGTMSSGTFDYTFGTEGTFPYFCLVHIDLKMFGTVIVNP